MNERLVGYTVAIPRLHFSLFGASLTLSDLTVRQQENPEPAVLHVGRLQASVQWKELIRLRLVADMDVQDPALHLNLQQLRQEVSSEVPTREKGWQQAVEEIYPLKINHVEIVNGELVYIDKDPKSPLVVRRMLIEASNIRNIRSKDSTYPSRFHAEGVVFETGKAIVDGHADFLAEPTPGVLANFNIEQVPLAALGPLGTKVNLRMKGGLLSGNGEAEFSVTKRRVHVRDIALAGLKLDYVHTEVTAGAEKRRTKEVVAATRTTMAPSQLDLTLDRFRLVDGNIGFINSARSPSYRLYLASTDILLENFSNQFRKGAATIKLQGRFMGSGPTRASATFRPEVKGADFQCSLAIEETDLTHMNNLLRAYGKFDASAGRFFLYSEIRVKGGRIHGYVKPFFKDLKAYDKTQDQDKGFFRKLYERMIDGVARIFENRDDNVATRAEIEGSLNDPKTSTLQIIGGILRNAFLRALTPSFDSGRRKKAVPAAPPPKIAPSRREP